MGDPTIETQSLPDSESVIVSQQYIGGVYSNHKMVVFGHQVSLKI